MDYPVYVFSQITGRELNPITVELTYGLERLAMYIQNKNSVYDIVWNDTVTYGDVHLEDEKQLRYIIFNRGYRSSSGPFRKIRRNKRREKIFFTGMRYVLKTSCLNLLNARGAVTVYESHLSRIRNRGFSCTKYIKGVWHKQGNKQERTEKNE